MEHCTSNYCKVMGLNPVQARTFYLGFLFNCFKVDKVNARIIISLIFLPQLTYMIILYTHI